MRDDTRAGATPAVWSRIGQRWEAFWDRPRARFVARTGRWTLRAMRWRRRMRVTIATARTTTSRLRSILPLAYCALPAAPPRPWLKQAKNRKLLVAPRVRIIANPTSGGNRGVTTMRELLETVDWLGKHGLPTEICITQRPGQATELAREAVKAGMDMVVAAGGDGTVNDMVQALAGTTTALGVLPLGTVNVWAREMDIPLNIPQARKVLLHGIRRQVDVGRAGSRYFLLMAGVGFDAEVARRVEKSRLKTVGLKLLDYLATVGILGMTHQSTRIWMRQDGKRRSTHALMVLIGNTRLYGGAFTFAKQAVADDGWLDVVVMGSGGLLYRLGVVLYGLAHRASLGPRIRYTRCQTIRLESKAPLPVQVDGEVIGTLPMTFSVAPRALTVVVPAHAPTELFVCDSPLG